MASATHARPTVTFPAVGHHRPLTGTKLFYCLMREAHVYEQLAQGCYLKAERTGVETRESQVTRSNHYTAGPHWVNYNCNCNSINYNSASNCNCNQNTVIVIVFG